VNADGLLWSCVKIFSFELTNRDQLQHASAGSCAVISKNFVFLLSVKALNL